MAIVQELQDICSAALKQSTLASSLDVWHTPESSPRCTVGAERSSPFADGQDLSSEHAKDQIGKSAAPHADVQLACAQQELVSAQLMMASAQQNLASAQQKLASAQRAP